MKDIRNLEKTTEPKTLQNDLYNRSQCGKIKKEDKSVKFKSIFEEMTKDD